MQKKTLQETKGRDMVPGTGYRVPGTEYQVIAPCFEVLAAPSVGQFAGRMYFYVGLVDDQGNFPARAQGLLSCFDLDSSIPIIIGRW